MVWLTDPGFSCMPEESSGYWLRHRRAYIRNGLTQLFQVTTAAQKTYPARIYLQRYQSIVTIASKQPQEAIQRQLSLSRRNVRVGNTITKLNIIQMDIVEYRTNDVIAGQNIFSIGAGMTGVEGHATVAVL